ncbi:MAG: hypothetical protein HY858_08185 [Candidatus Solibacter usitatus]|nr:hypothetical protein [Candidatus Solibacter usitatus]
MSPAASSASIPSSTSARSCSPPPAPTAARVGGGKHDYTVPPARQERPGASAYDCPELAWRMDKQHHVCFILRSEPHARVRQLLDEFTGRVQRDFWAFAPPKDKPTE